jgi:hypothetical protein
MGIEAVMPNSSVKVSRHLPKQGLSLVSSVAYKLLNRSWSKAAQDAFRLPLKDVKYGWSTLQMFVISVPYKSGSHDKADNILKVMINTSNPWPYYLWPITLHLLTICLCVFGVWLVHEPF